MSWPMRWSLARVISNLFENARRYGKTPSTDTTEVDVVAKESEKWVVIRIRDHGKGVPAEQPGQPDPALLPRRHGAHGSRRCGPGPVHRGQDSAAHGRHVCPFQLIDGRLGRPSAVAARHGRDGRCGARAAPAAPQVKRNLPRDKKDDEAGED